jgi:hypothetical protein
MPLQNEWLDLILVGGGGIAEQLFERSLGRAPLTEVENIGFMAELARMIAIGFTRMLKVRAGEIMQPLMSRAMRLTIASSPVPIPSEVRSYDLVIENLPFNLMLSTESCMRRALAPGAVNDFDILAGPFPPREVSSVPMFNQGAVMTPRFIEKMMTHDVAMQQGECVSVRRPSKLARYFNS